MKRAIWTLCLVALAVMGVAAPSWAAGYPDKPIQLIMPYAAGGSTDLLARVLQGATFDEKRMAQEAAKGFSTATDLADMLVRSNAVDLVVIHAISLPPGVYLARRQREYQFNQGGVYVGD
jgi:hypothetical protein